MSVSLWLQLQSIHPSASFPLVFLPQTEKRYRVPQWDVLRSQTACWAQGERLQWLCGFALMVYNYSQINYPRQAVVLLQTIRVFFLCWTQQHNSASSRIHAVSYYVVFIKVSLLCLSRVLPSLLCNLILRLSCSVALLPTEGSSFSLTLTPPSPFQPACVLGWWMSAAHWLERSGLLPPCLIRIITALCALFLSRITIQFNTLTGYYHFTSFCSGSWTRGESRARGGGQNTEPKQG